MPPGPELAEAHRPPAPRPRPAAPRARAAEPADDAGGPLGSMAVAVRAPAAARKPGSRKPGPPRGPATTCPAAPTPKTPPAAPTQKRKDDAPPAAAEGGPAPAPAPEAGAPAAGAGKPAAAAADLLMPEAPTAPTPAAAARAAAARKGMGTAAANNAAMPSPAAQVGAAQAAVPEPAEEAAARAAQDLTTELGQEDPPAFDADKLLEEIRTAIRERRPKTEGELAAADPKAAAANAGREVSTGVANQAGAADQQFARVNAPPAGSPAPAKQAAPGPVPAAAPAVANAPAAAPDAVPAARLSPAADAEATRQSIDAAGMNTPTAKLVQSGPIADARAAQADLDQAAEKTPAELIAAQQAALDTARTDLAGLEASAATALRTARKATTAAAHGRQGGLVNDEGSLRARITSRGQGIITDAQNAVRPLLAELATKPMQVWDAGLGRASEVFKKNLADVDRRLKEEYSGVTGAVGKVLDEATAWATSTPSWADQLYALAENQFVEDVRAVLKEIAATVGRVVAACRRLILDARQQLDALFKETLPAGLGAFAEEEKARFAAMLDGLSGEVTQAKDTFNKTVAERATQAVTEVHDLVEQKRQEAKGFIGRARDAVAAFLENPARAIINGLLEIVGIPPANFWALVDRIPQVVSDIADNPLGFANNLVDALGKGFGLFFDNVGSHLLQGLLDWLFSGLKGVKVEKPKDLSLKSIATFFLQLLGITWPRVRTLLVKHVGEKNVALVERAWAVIQPLLEMGPQGVYEMVKEQLDPKNILDMILNMAKDFVIAALIKQVAIKVVTLFNPAGAVFEALKLIYKVLTWVFRNAARLFRLVETVVNGVADLVKGNVGGMAGAVEKALAATLGPVIDFLADYIGIGDLPDKVAEQVQALQDWVYGIMDKVIGWVVEQGKRLLAAVGLGGKDEKKKDGKYNGEVGKVVRFTAGKESHRLWVVVQGAGVEVMMASVEKPTAEYLNEYEQMAEELTDDKKKGEVKGLIADARVILDEVKTKGTETVAASGGAEDKKAEAQQKDDQTEAAEERLAAKMREIQNALGLLTAEELEASKTRAKDYLDLIRGDGTGWYGKAAQVSAVVQKEQAVAQGRATGYIAYSGRKRSNGTIVLNLFSAQSPFTNYSKTWRREEEQPEDHHVASNKGSVNNFSLHIAFSEANPKYGIDINSAYNIITLHGHSGSHAESYHQAVRTELARAAALAGGTDNPRYTLEVIAALERLKKLIRSGELRLYSNKEVWEP